LIAAAQKYKQRSGKVVPESSRKLMQRSEPARSALCSSGFPPLFFSFHAFKAAQRCRENLAWLSTWKLVKE